MNRSQLIIIALILILLPSLYMVAKTGNATLSPNEGCCSTTCTITGISECSGSFFQGQECGVVNECNIGCCVDTEGYCYSNYVKGTCESENGQFIGARECSEYTQCLTAPAYPAEQEGYQFTQDGVMGTIPSDIAFTRGDVINLTSYLFQNDSVVILQFTSDKYSANWSMDNLKDSSYFLEWDSSVHPTISGLTNITVQNFVDEEKSGRPLELYMSPDYCLPSILNGKERILVSRTPSLDYLFSTDVLSFALNFFKYHGIENDYDFFHFTQPTTLTNNPCSEDVALVIQFDHDEIGCKQEGNVVTLNDQFAIKRKSLQPDFLDNFCDYVYTVDSKIKELEDSLIPPTLEIIYPDSEITTNESFSYFSFNASDHQNYSMRYSITADSDFHELKWGYMNSTTESLTIPLLSGTHEYYVTVEDLNGNFISDSVNITAQNISDINIDVPDLVIKADGEYTFILYDDETPLYSGDGYNNTEFYTPITKNSSLWAELYFHDGRRDASTFINYTTSYIPSSLSGFAVASTFSSHSSSDQGTTTEDGGVVGPDGYVYYPIDDSFLYEPQKLCSLGIDTGARYFPVNCINSNFTTLVSLNPSYKLYYHENVSYAYNFSYEVEVCDFETFVDVRLRDSRTNLSSSIEQETIDVGYKLVDTNNYFSPVSYDEVCVYTSDENNPEYCASFTLPECNDGLDNDGDGLCDKEGCLIDTDWYPEDPGCGSLRDLTEDGTTECMDGEDNDGDGLIDEADPACVDSSGNYQRYIDDESTETTQCQDGVDNDGDGLSDLDDPGCESLLDDLESDGTSQCQDGVDNDGDGSIDRDDNGCYTDISCFPDCYDPLINQESALFPLCELYPNSGYQTDFVQVTEETDHYSISYSFFNCGETTDFSIYLAPPNFTGKDADKYFLDQGIVGENENLNQATQVYLTEGNFERMYIQVGSSVQSYFVQ